MSGYHGFAEFYDSLTQNIPYGKRGEYFRALIQKYQVPGNILLDLACGTGSLSIEFARMGYTVIGVDSSPEMLSCAMNKKYAEEQPPDILFLCQPMQHLDLYGSFDICVSALDSINHLKNAKEVAMTFERVSLFMNPGGIFIFDVNTCYKHEQVLAGATFVYDCEEVFCVWQNSPCNAGRIDISLELFSKEQDSRYTRQTELFSEQAYTHAEILALLEGAGLCLLECLPDPMECNALQECTALQEGAAPVERMIYVAANRQTKQHP